MGRYFSERLCAEGGMANAHADGEYLYPVFRELVEYAVGAPERESLTSAMCDELLTILAPDNECEDVLDA